jgi:peptidoglycan/xylan/chitin deacetylase (PgdA/CDA1 family)
MSVTIPILMYHSVDWGCTAAYRRWTVSPARFEEQMSVLRDRGRVPLTVSELACQLRAGQLSPDAVAITFDDGLADFLDGALPVLDRLGFASTLFVTSGYVGETSRWLADLGEGERRMMSWDDIRGLAELKVEIGAHTHTHPQLDLLDIDEARWEIETSKALLEQHTGQPVRSFAYPHGYSTFQIRALVEKAGFAAACRVADGLMSTSESPFALSRVIVTEDWSPSRVEALLDGTAIGAAAAPDNAAARVWRQYRRLRSLIDGSASQRSASAPRPNS